MAINTIDVFNKNDEISAKLALSSTDAKYATMKSGFPSVCGSTSTVSSDNKNKTKSPYLAGEKIQLLSRVTEKRFTKKRATNFVSSFPFAANIYKGSSDDFNKPIKYNNNKPKKSVLTLPKTPSLKPQDYTVSDMTESEYFNDKFDNTKQKTKRLPQKKKPKQIKKDFMFYDRDAKYFSQLNIDLYSSSTDVGNDFDYDRRIKMNKMEKISNHEMNDVWSVLRSINKFQFKPSPPASDSSIAVQKKKTSNKRRRKDIRVIESCCQEEISYCSILDIESKTPSIETLISADRITVINENYELNKNNNAKECQLKLLIDSDKENPRKSKKEKKLTKKKYTLKSKKAKDSGNQANNERKLKKTETKPAVTGYEKGDFFELQFTDSDDDKIGPDDNGVIETEIKPHLVSIKVGPDDCEDYGWLSRENYSDEPTIKLPASREPSQKQRNVKLDSKKFVKKDRVKDTKTAAVNSKKQLNDIISDLLQKGEESMEAKKVKQNGKEREKIAPFTAMTTQHPFKTSYIDVRRYIHHLKFPIVVQNSDEISSTLLVTNNPPCQFDGLDKQVWPFMTKWYPWKKFKNTNDHVSKIMSPVSQDKSLAKQRNSITLRSPQLKISKSISTAQVKPTERIGDNVKQRSSLLESKKSKDKLNHPKKSSFKDMMLKLINKDGTRNQTDTIVKDDPRKIMKEIPGVMENKKFHAFTDMSFDSFCQDKGLVDDLPESIKKNKTKRRWSKAKWASDFIENVVKKVKNGVYYTQETLSKNIQCESKHTLIETADLADQSQFPRQITQGKSINTDTVDIAVKDESTGIETQKVDDHLKVLFGIDDLLTGLEVKILNMNQIAVKHCVTNVVVQFDVCLPTKNGAITKSEMKMNHIMEPLEPENETRVLKFKTSILNDILPAALCSLIPKIMKDILRKDGTGSIPLLVEQSNAYLSTISETSSVDVIQPKALVENNNIQDVTFPCEIYEPLTKLLDKIQSEVTIRPLIQKSSRTLNIVQGRFQKPNINMTNTTVSMTKLCKVSKVYNDLFPILSGSWAVPFVPNLSQPLMLINKCDLDESVMTSQRPLNTENNVCTAIQPYVSTALNSSRGHTHFNYSNIMKNMVEYLGKQNISKLGITLIIPGSKLNIYVDVMAQSTILDERRCVELNYDTKVNFDNEANDVTLKMITIHNSQENKIIETKQNTRSKSKFRGKSLKRCKKGKSTSNISSEKTTTPLSRITSLEDFFVILGWNKTLISVFDEASGQKIMDSIQEMKSFTKEISSRQALLIMLLANKKESINLTKFKPIILQAIAVNRITRSSELDMEIEVIEREHFCVPSEFEGFSRTEKTSENKLLEELYWIAKTTASDYQKSFDESSEKLLKDLLHKRKKLNPSYLRVMARYVGLGLLKAPMKQRKFDRDIN